MKQREAENPRKCLEIVLHILLELLIVKDSRFLVAVLKIVKQPQYFTIKTAIYTHSCL